MVFHIFFLTIFDFFETPTLTVLHPTPYPMHQKKCFFLAKLVHIYDVEEVKKYLEKKTIGVWGGNTPSLSSNRDKVNYLCTLYSL